MYIIIVIIVVVVVARGGGVGDSDGVTEVIMLTDRHTHRQQNRKTKKYVTHLKRRSVQEPVITKWMVTPNQHSVIHSTSVAIGDCHRLIIIDSTSSVTTSSRTKIYISDAGIVSVHCLLAVVL